MSKKYFFLVTSRIFQIELHEATAKPNLEESIQRDPQLESPQKWLIDDSCTLQPPPLPQILVYSNFNTDFPFLIIWNPLQKYCIFSLILEIPIPEKKTNFKYFILRPNRFIDFYPSLFRFSRKPVVLICKNNFNIKV